MKFMLNPWLMQLFFFLDKKNMTTRDKQKCARPWKIFCSGENKTEAIVTSFFIRIHLQG